MDGYDSEGSKEQSNEAIIQEGEQQLEEEAAPETPPETLD